MSETATETPAFDMWAIVELMGHQRAAGRIQETQIAGAGFLRMDIAAGDGRIRTRFIAPAAIYAINPVTEEIALAVAAQISDPPVYAYELPQLPVPTTRSAYGENVEDFLDRDDDDGGLDLLDDDAESDDLVDQILLVGYMVDDVAAFDRLTSEQRLDVSEWISHCVYDFACRVYLVPTPPAFLEGVVKKIQDEDAT